MLDPAGAQLDGHAHVEAVDPVLALEVGGAGQDQVLVENDGVDHLRRRRPWRVPGRGAEELDDLAAALGRSLDHGLDPVLGHELSQRYAADARGRDHRHHLVAVAAQHHRGPRPSGRRLSPRR